MVQNSIDCYNRLMSGCTLYSERKKTKPMNENIRLEAGEKYRIAFVDLANSDKIILTVATHLRTDKKSPLAQLLVKAGNVQIQRHFLFSQSTLIVSFAKPDSEFAGDLEVLVKAEANGFAGNITTFIRSS